MGVNGLWTLLTPVARPVALETLAEQKLAIDASMWMYQFQMATRDKKTGDPLQGAHIMGTFRRIMKLLYHGIKPVFVFDGDAPMLKRRTIAERKQRKAGATRDLAKTAQQLLSAQLRQAAAEHAIKEQEAAGVRRAQREAETNSGDLIGPDAVYLEDLEASNDPQPAKNPLARNESLPRLSPVKKFVPKDQYALPRLDGPLESRAKASDPRIATAEELRQFIDDLRPEDFDMDSEFFASLPVDAKYEIIGDLRIKSRQVNHRRVDSMRNSATPLDFSMAQITNLMQRNMYTQKLLTVTDELGQAHISIPTRVAGERNREYVLIKKDIEHGGGWVLGVKDPQAANNEPIIIDTTTDESVAGGTDSEEFEEVKVGNVKPRSPSPNIEIRRVLATEAIRARYATTHEPSDYDPYLDEPEAERNSSQLFGLQETQHADENEFDGEAEEDISMQKAMLADTEEERLRKNRGLIVMDDVNDSEGSLEEVEVTGKQFRNGEVDEGEATSAGSEDFEEVALPAPANPPHLTSKASAQPSMSPMLTTLPPPIAPRSNSTTAISQKMGRETSNNASRSLMDSVLSSAESESEADQGAEDEVLPSMRYPTDNIHLSERRHQATLKTKTELTPTTFESFPKKTLLDHQIHPARESVNSSTAEGGHDIGSSVPPRDIERPEPTILNSGVTAQPVQLPEENVVDRDDGETAEQEDNDDVNSSQAEEEDEEVFSSWEKSPTPSPRAEVTPLFREEEEEVDYEIEDELEMMKDLELEQDQYAAMISQLKSRRLEEMRQEAENDIARLKTDRNADQRNADGITRQMASDIKEMLQLFGIPYVDAPSEAEAECAELMTRRFVDGIVTDDSDVFLFGGNRVYRHMFNDNKYVECYLLTDLERELGLGRDRLVQLAYLLGGDYAEGLPGVGPVLGRELLAEFSGPDALKRFKEWWWKVQGGVDDEEDSKTAWRRKFKKGHKNLILGNEWPDPKIAKAYFQPTIGTDEEDFSWSGPDLDGLRTFLNKSLSWSASKTDELMLPLIKRQNQRRAGTIKLQSSLNDYFDVTAGSGPLQTNKINYESARLQQVVQSWRRQQGRTQTAGTGESVDEIDHANKTKVGRKRKNRVKSSAAAAKADGKLEDSRDTSEDAEAPKLKALKVATENTVATEKAIRGKRKPSNKQSMGKAVLARKRTSSQGEPTTLAEDVPFYIPPEVKTRPKRAAAVTTIAKRHCSLTGSSDTRSSSDDGGESDDFVERPEKRRRT